MERPGSQPAGIPLDEWLARTHQELGSTSGPALTQEEQLALLDHARIAARRSERIAAPLTTFLAGVALAGLASPAREVALRSVVARLEA